MKHIRRYTLVTLGGKLKYSKFIEKLLENIQNSGFNITVLSLNFLKNTNNINNILVISVLADQGAGASSTSMVVSTKVAYCSS